MFIQTFIKRTKIVYFLINLFAFFFLLFIIEPSAKAAKPPSPLKRFLLNFSKIKHPNPIQKSIELNMFLDRNGCLDHKEIRIFLNSLPSAQPSNKQDLNSWEPNIKRNLNGLQINNEKNIFKIAINGINQEYSSQNQKDAILDSLRSNHKEILPLLEQENAIAYPSLIKGILGLYIDKTSTNYIIKSNITYFIDSKSKRVDYLTIFDLVNPATKSVFESISIHHHAKFNLQGGVNVHLDHYQKN